VGYEIRHQNFAASHASESFPIMMVNGILGRLPTPPGTYFWRDPLI